jgi:hypothetical protein
MTQRMASEILNHQLGVTRADGIGEPVLESTRA